MSEEAKESLKKSIWKAFDTWAAKYYDTLLFGENTNREAAMKEAHLEDLFLSKRVFIPGFNRYVTQALTSNPDQIRKRKTLVKASLLSMLRPTGVAVAELKYGANEEDTYSRRQLQRIIGEEYPELFHEVERRKKDKRITPISTSFSPFSLPDLERPFTITKAIREQNERLKKRDDLLAWMTRNNTIIGITPEHLEDFTAFRDDCLKVLREINDNSDACKILLSDLKQGYELSSVYHAHLLSIRSVVWYRSRSPRVKRSLIDDGFPLRYDEMDVERSRILLTALAGAEPSLMAMQLGAASLMKMKLYDSANAIYGELLNSDALDDLKRGLLHENRAVIHRYLEQPKLMVREMHLALGNYLKTSEKYRISLVYKNLGEAEWVLGYKEAADNYFREAESRIKELTPEERDGVYRNLSFTAWRIRNVSMELEYLHKWMTANPESPTELILEINRRIDTLLSNRYEKEPRLYVGPN